jgi:menaquinone-dependent protoporphyrinogen oxidase
MSKKVLVTYGSRYGGTREIAEEIGKVLKQEDLEVDILSADRAGDPTRYDALIIGSAVYIGQWRKEAANYLKNNEARISGKPLWLFSTGPTGEGDPVELMKGWRYPKKLEPVINRLKPRDIAVFGGVAKESDLNFLFKFMLNRVKAPLGDFRNWDAITDWAKSIAAELKSEVKPK